MVDVITAKNTLPTISNNVFKYNFIKSILFMTSVKFEVIHFAGNIVNGFTDVDSVTVLKAVSAIHAKGTIIVMDTMISIT